MMGISESRFGSNFSLLEARQAKRWSRGHMKGGELFALAWRQIALVAIIVATTRVGYE